MRRADPYALTAPTVGDHDDLPLDGETLKGYEDPYALLGCLELLPVSPRSPLRLRRAVETIAQFFRREFHYDFCQYDATERPDPRDAVFLWLETCNDPGGARALGAACFRWRQWQDAPPGLALAFCWLHPHYRGKGVLAASWPLFRERLGDFVVERPLSKAMQRFLLKHDPEKLGPQGHDGQAAGS
jgi:hypothetical protein